MTAGTRLASLHWSAGRTDARRNFDATHAPWVLPPLPIDDVITADNRLVEVTVRWRGRVTDVKRVPGTASFTVGTDGGDDAAVAVDGGSFTVVRGTPAGRCRVRFTNAMACVLRRGPDIIAPVQAGVVFDGGAWSLGLADDDVVTLCLGQHTVTIRTVSRSRRVAMAAAFDALWANAATITMMGATALLAVALLMPVGMAELDDDLLINPTRFQKVLVVATPKDNAFLARMTAPSSAIAARRAVTERTKPVKTAVAPVTATKPALSDDAVVRRSLTALFGDAGAGGVGSVFGDSSANSLTAALGGLDASRVASTEGMGRLGLRGGGADGVGVGTIGIGRTSVRGRSSGDVVAGGDGGLIGKRDDRDIDIVQGPHTKLGALDPALIRQVVQSHAGQVRYCYESRLVSTPGLTGKIVMRWIISADGHVRSVTSSDNQMGDDVVAACLGSRVSGWVFPRPKGGGIVVVTYPFVFKPAG